MTKQEAVAAFLTGSIGRRDFIQKLSIAGVSGAAAVAYANTLRPASASAAGGSSVNGVRRAFQDDYVTATAEATEAPATSEEISAAIASVTEALGAVADVLDALVSDPAAAVAALAALGITGPIADGLVANLANLQANLAAQIQAITAILALLGAAHAPARYTGIRMLQAAPANLIEAMGGVMTALAGVYSGILATSDNVEVLNELGPYASVAGRQAAYFATLLGEPAFPNPSEPAATQDDLIAAVEALQSFS